MRIGVVSERVEPSRGGAETYVAELCAALARRGHAPVLIAGSWDESAIGSGVERVRIALRSGGRMGRIWEFGNESERYLSARGHEFDATIGFINTWAHDVLLPQGGVRAASLESNANRYPAGPARWLYRAGKVLNPKHWIYREIEARQYDLARRTRYVAPSHWVAGHLARFHGVRPDRVRVIHNAIDAARLRIDDPVALRKTERARFQYSDDDVVALFVGHNFRLKGLHALLAAVAERMRRNPGARRIQILACGAGSQGPMRQIAKRLGIDDALRFAGYVADVRSVYAAADLFALPTYYDPCSLVVFEALAFGLPVITTAYNGAGEVMTQAREGFVVSRPDAISELADALDALSHDETRAGMSTAARALGAVQTFDQHLDRLLELFEEIAVEKRNSRRVAA
jgi:UDP-glucose:(heptosyl)LPS alpha-1,3-glucosyltransferase